MVPSEIKLKVMEAVQDDVNKGLVKIDSSYMKQIGANIGDIVEIKGERNTAAIVDRAYPGDIGLNIVRMDGNIRRNARTSIGEMVTVTKAEVKPAKKVSIAPTHKGVMIKASPDLFKHGLQGKALVKGDIVSLGRASRRRVDLQGREIADIFSMMEEQFAGFGFGDLKFIVVDTNPKKEIVVVTAETEIEFNPQAIDVKEEEAIGLGINYEDIGGLGEEIKKVREMIELPLKHPEIFEKLGIEAPKGVLLHGPPGTGKTLLAKAVASETNSHFILINGPEVISKFYGESLPYDEKVLVRKEGLIQRLKIGEIVENQWNVDIVCFNKENKIIFKKVDQFIKHPSTNKIYRVRTKSGRSIRVTADHNLFTLGDKGIESVKTSDLQPKKSFIVVPQRLPCHGMLYALDLLDQLSKEDYGLMVQNVSEYLEEAVHKIGLKECARELGVKTKYCYDLRSKNVGIRVSKFVALMNKAGIEINKQTLQIGTKRNWLPAILPLNEDLVHFFGWWMAEGSYTPGAVRVSLHCNELNYMFSLVQRLFGTAAIYHKKNSFGADVFVHSTVLKIIMEKVIGFVSGSAKKHIPTIIFNLDKDRIAAFLRGYFSGDGSVNFHGKAPQVEVSSASHCLIDDVCYLLLHFGIVAKIYDKPSENSKRLTFASFDHLNKFREIGFVDNNRNKLIYDYINTSKFSRESQLPLTGQLAQLVQSDSRFSAWKNSRSIGSTVVAECLPEVSNALALGDLAFDMVQEITEEEQPKFVYDLSVPYDHNFLAGFGGIFAHNSEANLRKKFEEAEQNAPSIIFFDEIDAIATKREETRGDVEKRVVAQLLGLMDGLKSRGKVIVIAATNIPNQLDLALRRPGRFDREIEIGVPNKEGRLEILQIHTRNMPLAKNVNLKEIARITHGFVGADLNALAKEAAMIVLRKILPDLKVEGLKEDQPIPAEILEKLKVDQKDFIDALKVVRPSAMREVLVEIPDVTWDDIGGLEEVKEKLKESVEWPLKRPEVFKRMGIRPPRGILLYGPPGTGKTLLAKAVAKESEANFILVNGPSLLSKWVGESEKAVREIFRKARQTAPTILFFDEIDSLVPRRGRDENQVHERVVNQMLTELDGLESLNDVVILGATNRPDMLDPALLRPGRFDRVILTSIPDEAGRKKIFQIYLEKMPLAAGVDAAKLAKKTEGYVGADIEAVCREAAMSALRKDIKVKELTMAHFDDALKQVRPSVDKEIEDAYANLESYFTSARAKQIKEDKAAYFG